MAHGVMTLLLFYSLALSFASVLCSQPPFFFNPSANTHTNYSGIHTRNHLHKIYYHVLALSQTIMHYLFERSKHPSAHDYSHSATLDELWINRCWCWMHATPAYVCMCLCSCCQCVARICMCYTYMHVYSALMSLRVSPCSPWGQTLWVQRSRARSGAWAGHPAAAHRGATVLLLLPPSDQRTAWVLQFQPQHKTLVSGFPQSNPATAEAPFVPTLNKT